MGWLQKQEAKLVGKKVLVIGAGGIGCELLKNIVLTGFKDIHVIDLDTIDVSNLNRQFLFRREHVGKSKAEVATAAVRNLLPGVNITYDHDSIFNEKFGFDFFSQFTLVFNALDNRAARNHVNRICLASRIPLIESGSSGYLGQVVVIIRDRTECFECVPKEAQQKTFPGCTIRNTPSEHIHCTVWAKHLFNQLFGELDIDDDVSPDFNDPENKSDEKENGSPQDEEDKMMNGTSNGVAENGTNGHDHSHTNEEKMEQGEEEQEKQVEEEKELENVRVWAERENYAPEKLFTKLFHDDINYLLIMTHLWKERRRPIPLNIKDYEDQGCSSSQNTVKHASDDINKVWSGAENVRVFCECVQALYARKHSMPEGSILTWDKDDNDAMRFVAACANIRATIFGIPTKTFFEIKSMAGNIIPAIATTNAMVAGMMVLEALKVIDNDLDSIKSIFIRQEPNPRGKILVDQLPGKPVPHCYVCSDKRQCFVKVNPAEMTIKSLEDKVLKGYLNMIAPDVMDDATKNIVISSEEGETDGIAMKKMVELKIGEGCILDCDDFVQKLAMKIIIVASSKMKGDEFQVLHDMKAAKSEEQPPAAPEEDETRKRKSLHIEETDGVEAKRSRTEVEV